MRAITKRNAILTTLAATVAATSLAASANAAPAPVTTTAAKAAVTANIKKTQKPAKVTTVKCFRLVGGSARCEVTLDYGYRVCRDTIVSVRRTPRGTLTVVGLAPTCKAAAPIEAPDEPANGGTTPSSSKVGSGSAPATPSASVPAANGLITPAMLDRLKAQKAMYAIRAGTVALDMSRIQYEPAGEGNTGPNGQTLMAYYWVVVSGGRTVAIDVQYQQLDATGTWVNAFAVRSVGGTDAVDPIDNFM